MTQTTTVKAENLQPGDLLPSNVATNGTAQIESVEFFGVKTPRVAIRCSQSWIKDDGQPFFSSTVRSFTLDELVQIVEVSA
jgi:hypothetical protein